MCYFAIYAIFTLSWEACYFGINAIFTLSCAIFATYGINGRCALCYFHFVIEGVLLMLMLFHSVLEGVLVCYNVFMLFSFVTGRVLFVLLKEKSNRLDAKTQAVLFQHNARKVGMKWTKTISSSLSN